MKRFLLLVVFLFSIFGLTAFADSSAKHHFEFHRASGTHIVNSAGLPVMLRGISFGNKVWPWGFQRIPVDHHGPEDFSRVRDMGMNLVRFYINYQTLESDEKPYIHLQDGWQWLDDNIAWARANGVYLIFNMHVPQGGFQSHGNAWKLWQEPELQNRLLAMWVAIARRYANEPVILGYDLVNEPGVPDSKQQWQKLAQRLTTEIRKVDKNHPIFIERVNSINGKWVNDKDMNFVRVQGENIIYTFHSYDPYFYTHQQIPWDDYMKNRDGGVWPDKKKKHTRAYLAKTIERFLAWGKKHNVPLYFGEWGVYKINFESERGGINYIADMLSVLEEKQLTNTFHVYHEESFGLYRGDGKLNPANVNQALLDLFKKTYAKKAEK